VPTLLVTAVRLHCAACGEQATLTGPGVQDLASLWGDAHYQPIVDEVDLASTDDKVVCTWRQTEAA